MERIRESNPGSENSNPSNPNIGPTLKLKGAPTPIAHENPKLKHLGNKSFGVRINGNINCATLQKIPAQRPLVVTETAAIKSVTGCKATSAWMTSNCTTLKYE